MENTELQALGYISVDEAARLVGLKNPGTLRNWRSLGKGPKYVPLHGRLIVYKRSDVEAWMTQRTVEPHPDTAPTLVHSDRSRRRRRAPSRHK